MQNLIRINNDMWDDAGKVYEVISYQRMPNSTGVKLQLEYNGVLYNRVVPLNQIEWIHE